MAEETQGRARPSRAGEDPSQEPDQPKADVQKPKPTNGRRRGRKPNVLTVYFEDETGILTPLGDFKGKEPEEAMDAYLASLEDGDRDQALGASTYAVNTKEGLVKLAIMEERKLVVTRR